MPENESLNLKFKKSSKFPGDKGCGEPPTLIKSRLPGPWIRYFEGQGKECCRKDGNVFMTAAEYSLLCDKIGDAKKVEWIIDHWEWLSRNPVGFIWKFFRQQHDHAALVLNWYNKHAVLNGDQVWDETSGVFRRAR